MKLCDLRSSLNALLSRQKVIKTILNALHAFLSNLTDLMTKNKWSAHIKLNLYDNYDLEKFFLLFLMLNCTSNINVYIVYNLFEYWIIENFKNYIKM